MNKLKFKLLSLFVLITFFFSSSIAPALAAVTYTYDANGNQISDGTKCYHYNQANQMDKVTNCSSGQTIAEYVYDYNGTRLVKREFTNGVLSKTTYSPADEFETVKQASNGATANTSYYKANDETIAKKNPDGTITYYHNDHLGSTSVLSDQTGTLVERTTYEPYGKVKSGGTQSKFGYTGQEQDNESGLDYYNARYYDPHIQRFTQPDDIVQDIYDPQMLNRYSYVRNNPLRYTDPTGHCFGPFILICAPIIIAFIPMIIAMAPMIAQPIHNAIQNPSPKNVAAAVVDVGSSFIPEAKGAGSVMKTGEKIAPKVETAIKGAADNFKASNFRKNLTKATGGVQKGADAHHIFPQKFRSNFDDLGLKIDDPQYGAWWERSPHRKNAYDYNEAWEGFLYGPETVTKEGVLDFGKRLMGSYGLEVRY